MIPPMNNPPNRLDQLRAGASPMPPAGSAPIPPPPAGGRPPMPMPPPPAAAGPKPPMPPPPMMAEEPPMGDDRLGELMAMEEEPMMPEEMEEGFSTQDVATGIASSALQISGSPEQALMAVEQAADELRALLS